MDDFSFTDASLLVRRPGLPSSLALITVNTAAASALTMAGMGKLAAPRPLVAALAEVLGASFITIRRGLQRRRPPGATAPGGLAGRHQAISTTAMMMNTTISTANRVMSARSAMACEQTCPEA